MDITISIAANREPQSFHKADHAFAVFRSLNVAGDPSENNNAEARNLFSNFFQGKPAFDLYVIKANHLLVKVGKFTLTTSYDSPPLDIKRLMGWLDTVSNNTYIAESTDEVEVVADGDAAPDAMPAAQWLRAAPNWDAPVPQRMRLVVLVTFPIIPDWEKGDKYYLLPQLPNESSLEFVDSGEFISVHVEDGQLQYTIQTEKLVLENDPDPFVKDPDSFVEEGFLIVESGADSHHRLAQKIEERAASLFWTTPHFLSLSLEQLNEASESGQPENNRSVLATIMAASLLDPMLIALWMPGIPEADGPLLAPHINDLLIRARTLSRKSGISNDLKNFLTNTRGEHLREVWRKLIGAHKLIDKADAKEDVIPAIQGLLNLNDAADRDLLALMNGKLSQFNESILQSLRTHMTDLQDELGAERVLIRFLEEIGGNFVEKWCDSVESGASLKEADKAKIKILCTEAFEHYRRLVLGSFNGAEAIRQAMGQVYLAALARGVIVKVLQQWGSWLKAIKESQHFMRRLIPDASSSKPSNSKPLDSVLSGLWKSDSAVVVNPQVVEALDKQLKSVHDELARDLETSLTIPRRFQPDRTPQPLPIQIAPNMDRDTVETFTKRYAGIGVLVQRGKDKDKEGWRHVCLTALKGALDVGHALRPLKPVVTDGHGGMFLDYAGFPLATSAFTSIDDSSALYSTIESKYGGTSKPEPVPTLQYGQTYQVASFVASKAGSLPNPLQEHQLAKSWYPKLDLNNLLIPNKYVAMFPYKRRTAIGRVELSEAGSVRRLGARYPDVEPLSLDAPRLGLGLGFLDLFRNPDGSGTLDLMALAQGNNPIKRTLNDLRATGGISVELRNAMSPDEKGLASHSFNVPLDFLHIVVQPKDNNSTQYDNDSKTLTISIVLGNQDIPPAWLRLAANPGASGASLNLARPEADSFDTQYAADSQPPIVLLGKAGSVWSKPFDNDFSCTVKLSRVGFLDVDCWRTGYSKEVLDRLLEAYVIAAGDPHDPAVLQIANGLDQLPDPAVGGYLVTATLLDSAEAANQFSAVWIDPATIAKIQDIKGANPNLRAYQDWLKGIALLSERTLKVEVEDDGNLEVILQNGNISVHIPEGQIARIAIHPLVAEEHFGKHIDPRIKEHCVGKYTHSQTVYRIFGGECFLAETMKDEPDLFKDLTEESFLVSSQGLERAYTLSLKLEDKHQQPLPLARLVSQCDVSTQRWRFSGKPIYQWIAPRECAKDQNVATAAFQLDSQKEHISPFEQQLFFDRLDSDHHTIRVRVATPSTEQVLQRIGWDQPSATYFRHRFTLWSRYRGAMKSGTKSVNSWKDKLISAQGVWTLRAVILADPDRVQLTRPQLRALVPLSSGLKGNPEASPPLAAIVEEPPFACGGLAERLLAGIQLGAGYGFEKEGDTQVTPLDLRHEIGPDPRLSQHALGEADALGATLQVEGPVGLHFESANISAPRWVNTQYLLSPRVLIADKFIPQESFVAVRMLRLLDPDWVANAPNLGTEALDPTRAYLATFERDENEISREMHFVTEKANEVVIKIEKASGYLDVTIDRKYIDGSATPEFLKIASIDIQDIASLQLLHWPINSGAYGLAVLAKTVNTSLSKIEAGESSVPMLLAALEWRKPDGDGKLSFEETTKITPVNLSEATEMQWARTARNSDTAYVRCSDGSLKFVPVSELRLRTQKDELWFTRLEAMDKILLQPFQPEGNYPQTVHRHLAAILTHNSEGLGRCFDVFERAVLVPPNAETMLNTSKKSLSAARLLEFQVPAKPIYVVTSESEGSIPSRYQKIYLDLLALTTPETKAYWLHVRFVGNPPKASITISARLFGKNGECGTKPIKLPLHNNGASTRDLFLVKDGEGGWGLMDENLTKGNPIVCTDPQGMQLVMTSEQAEIWADVSLLPLELDVNVPSKDRSHSVTEVEWSWFFTSKGGSKQLADELDTAALRELPEASAQIVSYSSPIYPTK